MLQPEQVNGSGVVTAIADGTTEVTAASSSVTGSTMLIVQSGTPALGR
jgi:hypothetical protein